MPTSFSNTRNIALVILILIPILLTAIKAEGRSRSDLQLEFSPQVVESRLTTDVQGRSFSEMRKGRLYSLGLTSELNEKLSVLLALGSGDLGKRAGQTLRDRVVSVQARYTLFAFSPDEVLEASTGTTQHSFSSRAKNLEAYGVLAGFGLRRSSESIGFGLVAQYEQSLYVQSHRVDGKGARNRFRSFIYGASLSVDL